jgi:hypothetical protein
MRIRLAIFRGDDDFIRQHLPQLGYGEGGDPTVPWRVGGATAGVHQLPVDPPKHTLLLHAQRCQPRGQLVGTHLLLYGHHRIDLTRRGLCEHT